MANNGAVVKASADPANFVNMPPDGALYAIPDDSRYDVSDLTSERMNAQAVFQFRPADSITMTLDYTYLPEQDHGNAYGADQLVQHAVRSPDLRDR